MSAANENKPVCVVTGGTSGVGNAVAQLFAKQGYLIATCGRNLERLGQLQAALQSSSNDHFVTSSDLSDIEQTRQFAQQVLTKFERVDVLVNNAAVAPLGPFEEISSDTFEQLLDVNIRTPFFLTQEVWKRMKQQGRGVVVNISSLAAVDPFPSFSIYGASKAWIDLMTQALASEGQENNIRVCSIRPGAVETPMLRGLFPDFPAEQCVSPQVIADTVMKCVEQPENFPSGQHFAITNQT